MISLDTNVLARIFLEDDKKEADIAKKLVLSKKQTFFISSYALVELVWVLRSKRVPRNKIIDILENLLNNPKIKIGNREIVTGAFIGYFLGKVDFADNMIISEGIDNGAEELASFDNDLVKERLDCKHPKTLI